MEGFFQDLRHSLRMLGKNPGFALTTVLTLALGIGASTAIFSVVHSVLLRPLPYADPQRLVVLNTVSTPFGPGLWPVSYPNFADYRDQTQVFQEVAVARVVTLNLTGNDQTERLDGARVSSCMLRLFGLNPYLGRDFTADEEKPGAPPVLLLGHGLWQRRFGADPALLGRTISLDGQSFTVIGILPPGLQYPSATTDFWFPLIPGQPESIRGNYFLRGIGRLKKGVARTEADAQMKAIAARLEKEYPQPNTGASIELLPLHEVLVGNVRPALWVLFGAVGFVLLIACANIANLLLARSASRSGELAIRSALGADRRRLLRQLLTESLLLSLLGGALGLALAVGGLPLLTGLSSESIPRAAEIRVDSIVLLFTTLLVVLTAIGFGLSPALHLTSSGRAGALREVGRRGATRGAAHRRVLSGLIVTEVALSLVLLVGAGLLLRSLLRLQDVHPGFTPQGLLTFEMGAAGARYPMIPQQAEFYRKVIERVAAVPGVESAAAVHRLPMFRFPTTTAYLVEGRPQAPGTTGPTADVRVITPGYFHTMKIPLLEGRDLTERDAGEAPKVIVVSKALADQQWPGESPLGKRLQIGANQTDLWEIVGVVGNVRLRGLDKDSGPVVYWTTYQNFFPTALRSVTMVVRARADAGSVAASVRAAVREVDPQEGLASARTMEQVIAASFSQRQLNLALMLVFAGLAGVLAAVGLYGVMSYSVNQRTQEIGIRIALGADSGAVRRMVLGQGMRLVSVGVVVGLAGALALTRVMQSLLFSVNASDPATLGGVALLLAAVAFVATWLPARRASRVDPLIALRHE